MKKLDAILKFFFGLFESARPLKSELINEILSDPVAKKQFRDEFYKNTGHNQEPLSVKVKYGKKTLEFIPSKDS